MRRSESLAPQAILDEEIDRLLSGSPGTIGRRPVRVGLVASSRMSRRISAFRAFLSGPWQRKQVSDMIGRTSRLKLTRSGSAAAAAAAELQPMTTATIRRTMALSYAP